jgi:hypothetical protein
MRDSKNRFVGGDIEVSSCRAGRYGTPFVWFGEEIPRIDHQFRSTSPAAFSTQLKLL